MNCGKSQVRKHTHTWKSSVNSKVKQVWFFFMVWLLLHFIRVHYLQIRTKCGCMSTNCNRDTSSTTEEEVTVSLADTPPVVPQYRQAGIPSFTLGLRASTYYLSINPFVLLMQYGTLCQVHISCLGSYYQRGKTPHVYLLATWQQNVVGSFCSLLGP